MPSPTRRSKAARRREAEALADRLEIDLDLAYQVLDGRLTDAQARRLQDGRPEYEPFVILTYIALHDASVNPLVTLTDDDTRALAHLVTGLFPGDLRAQGLAVAVLGQAYAADQVVNDEVAHTLGDLVSGAVFYGVGSTVPVSYHPGHTVFPEPLLPPGPATPAGEGGVIVHTVCFPCTLVGRNRDLDRFLAVAADADDAADPFLLRDEHDPALQALRTFIASRLVTQERRPREMSR